LYVKKRIIINTEIQNSFIYATTGTSIAQTTNLKEYNPAVNEELDIYNNSIVPKQLSNLRLRFKLEEKCC
jgi:hypothetical protein